ncbi:unnamed protein product [Acanthoscelides obtectus]|uniref:Uncharacterized protein n=1 Tax=Acanthoscelides obtectus TaxID=200917 RepID=A0A9P0LM64_ACAOB|nr:unnamed protein product [Acanthoscelides obtectus]CAK1657479.1 hypothetical protein AOBTE_LOCUS20359 [Acanthoscelides obtectus]
MPYTQPHKLSSQNTYEQNVCRSCIEDIDINQQMATFGFCGRNMLDMRGTSVPLDGHGRIRREFVVHISRSTFWRIPMTKKTYFRRTRENYKLNVKTTDPQLLLNVTKFHQLLMTPQITQTLSTNLPKIGVTFEDVANENAIPKREWETFDDTEQVKPKENWENSRMQMKIPMKEKIGSAPSK